MSDDVIIGYDGRARCAWAGADDTASSRYHDEVWGTAPRSIADIPSTTPQAEALAVQLKAQGYRFVGPTSVYSFMQNVGMVNDHVRGCFRATGHDR